MPVSPNVQNYHIGKGIVSFKEEGGSTFVDLGNAPSFVYEPSVTKLEHFSSMEGVKTKDFTAVSQIAAKVTLELDEITALNLSFFALGEVDDTVPTAVTIAGLTKAEFTGDIKVVGSNDIGQKIDFLATVSFVPTGSFSFITAEDAFSVITLEAEVQKDVDGAFGVWTVHEPAVVP